MTTSAVAAVKKRLGHVASGTEEAPAALDSVVHALAANHEALQDDTITWREALGGVSFVHSLGADGASAGGVRRPTLWGGADYRSLSGGGEAGLPWDGGVSGIHLGFDARFGDVLLGGLALSMTEGSFDYTDRTGAVEVPGTYETSMTSVSPYAAWLSSGGSTAWAMVGYGAGESSSTTRRRGGRSATAR